MGDSLRAFIYWFATERGCATLDYGGGLLLGLEYFAIILGDDRVKRINEFLVEVQKRLDPKNAEATAKWLTFGPMGIVAAILVLVVLGRVINLEIHDPKARFLFSSGQPGADYTDWSWKMFSVVLWKPLGLLGLLAGIWLSRSPQAAESFEKLIGSTFGWLSKPANSPVPSTLPTRAKEPAVLSELLSLLKALSDAIPYVSLFAKFCALVLLLTFVTGFYAAKYGMLAMFYAFPSPVLKLAAFILKEQTLRWIAAFVGLAMLTTSYIIRMTGKK